MNPEMLFPVAAECLLKGSLLVLAAATFCAWRPALSASRRHVVWLCVLAGLAVLPLSRLAAPHWRLPGSLAPTISAAKSPLAMPVAATNSSLYAENVPARPPAWSWPKPWQMLLGAWAAGALAILGYRLLGRWQLARLRRQSTALRDPRWHEMAALAAAETGWRGRFEIRLSSRASVPCTWGLRKPVVLLPSASAGWSDAQLQAVLRHEFAHAARRDYLIRWFATVICALHWPNPLAWLAARRLQAAQEQACDDLVLRAGTPANEYADLLFETARAATGNSWRAAVAMARPGTLEGRVLAVVDPACDRRSAGRGFALVTALCLLSLLGAGSLAQVATTPVAADQIQLEVKFMEFTPQAFAAVPEAVRLRDPAKPQELRVLTDDATGKTALLKMLNERPGVDVLSAPRVTSRSGQSATIEVGRELVYPVEWEKAGAAWKPTKFKTHQLGVSFTATPLLKPDGRVELQAQPQVTELLGWEDLDTHQKLEAARQLNAPEGRRARPTFSERKLTDKITLRFGQTAACWLPPAGKADGQEEPRRVLVLVSATLVKESAAAAQKPPLPAPVATNGAATKAKAIIIPRLNFREATLAESIDYLRAKSREFTPDHAGVNLVNQLPPSATPAKITLDLKEVSLLEAARYVAKLAGVELLSTQDALVFSAEQAPLPTAPAAPSAALERAQRLVIPKLEFNEAGLEECLEYLRQRALALDAEKKGVNIVLQPNQASTAARLTLSLTNVPLSEALKYVATLAGLELRAEPEALVLAAPAPKEAGAGKPADEIAIELTGVTTVFKDGVAIAEGKAEFKRGNLAVTAERITYSPDRRTASFEGPVEYRQDGHLYRGKDLTCDWPRNGEAVFHGQGITKVD
ncbi:MAG TPA: M56 family metallopeptidase [Chthoniobacteraceae bacterium]|jgi:beta-lactamase regulating signal transducer with metallopeptidase domain|nr:M56 family metallopeptidase [Chthoniobacteraceae bacterium]